MLSFKQKQVIHFRKGEKLPIFCYNYFFKWNMWFVLCLWPKNWKGWSDNIETFHKRKSGVLEKNPRKRKSYHGSPSCSNWASCNLTNHIAALRVSQPMAAWVLKYFLSETIDAQENGSRGTHFAKFLISDFLRGLTYSAVYHDERWSLPGEFRFPTWLCIVWKLQVD